MLWVIYYSLKFINSYYAWSVCRLQIIDLPDLDFRRSFYQISIYFTKHGFSLKSILGYFKSFSLWQLLFNVLLTVPFGMYMHYYFKKSFKETVLYTFLLSLFYELTQLSALYGIYPGPYRLADIEDLICNTLGGALGYLLTDLLIKYLPDRDAIDERCRVRGRQISGWRRFWAVFFDFLVLLTSL